MLIQYSLNSLETLNSASSKLKLKMIGKSVYLLAFLVSIAFVVRGAPEAKWSRDFYAVNNTSSHHLIVGSRLPGDRLVLVQNVFKDSSYLQIVTKEQTFNVSKYERITQLRALDQKINGKGATAALLKGGPGTSAVTLRFKSQRGHSIKFVVELYARPWNNQGLNINNFLT